MTDRPAVTTLLGAVAQGNAAAQAELYALVYDELKRIARGALRRNANSGTMNPSTLVHEAFLKLAGDSARRLNDSHHFYSLLARAMRQVILDAGRQRGTVKHGVGMAKTQLTEGLRQEGAKIEDLLAIDDALRKLEALDPELAQLVELHFFAGVSFVDIAAMRGVTERTVRRHWNTARAFLVDAMPVAV
jgi:RNA polymerase sigma factor (TIGR02999 family)